MEIGKGENTMEEENWSLKMGGCIKANFNREVLKDMGASKLILMKFL